MKGPNICLSSFLATWFRVGVPLVLFPLWVFSTIAYVAKHDFSLTSILAYVLYTVVSFLLVRGTMRLFTVRVSGQDISFTNWFRVYVRPASEVMEVSVKRRRSIPWAVFRLSSQCDQNVAEYHTILRPYLITGRYPELDVFRGLRVRYVDWLGRERVEITGEKTSGKRRGSKMQ